MDEEAVILVAKLDPGDIGEMHDRAIGVGLDDDLGEFVGRRQARLRRHRGVQMLARRIRRLPDLAGRDVDILRLHRRLDVGRHELHGGELVRIEPNAHRILRSEHLRLADARHARDIVLEMADEIVGHVRRLRPVLGIVDRDDDQEVVARLGDGDALLLHLLRQTRQRLLDAVLHLHLRGIGVGALGEGDADADGAVGVRARREIEHPVERGELLLDRLGDARFERLGIGARIGGVDLHRRRCDVRKLRDRQAPDREDADQHDADREHPGEDRPGYEETAEIHGVSLPAWLRARPGRQAACSPIRPAPA